MPKKLAIVFGIVFVLVGIMGFIGTSLVGSTGLFETNTLHDIVHLLIGIILLTVAILSPAQSALWLKILGVVYFVLAVLGFLVIPAGGELLGLVHANTADHVLHLVLGVVLFCAGMWAGKQTISAPMTMPMSTPPSGGAM